MSDEPQTKPGAAAQQPAFPAGLHNAYIFASFNALSYQIMQGSPIILYAKSLGASATGLGIVAGMMPLLVISQIPAASYINHVGYRRFVLGGWSTRVAFIFAVALVPLTAGFLDAPNRFALLLALLFCFNLSRGISSCAWMPWIAQLVPAQLRGKYIARDTALQNLASFGVFLVSAACLAGETKSWQFAALFAFSATAGAASLLFLKKIPDVPIEESVRTSKTRVPWMEMLRYPPFRKLLRSVVGWAVAYGGIGAFTVSFLKSEGHMSESEILLVSSVAFLGGLSSLWFLGGRLDRLGSRPVIGVACAAWILILCGWIMLAAHVVEARLAFVLALQFLMGLFAALVNMANTRLAMAVVPAMGRNHFFALYSVLANVALGLAPILWGVLIDAVGAWHGAWHGLEWNRYSIFFAAAACVFGVTLVLSRRLEEPQAASMEELLREILVESPQRFLPRTLSALSRFWPRE